MFNNVHFKRIADNKEHNNIISIYYDLMAKEFDDKKDNFYNKKQSLDLCQSYWLLDDYKKIKVRDIKRVCLCKDRFCNNCKKVKQANQMAKYNNLISNQKYLYHVVLTVPNCSGDMLEYNVDLILKKFRFLIRYLNLTKKIKGLNFDISYLGALRSLEITYNNDNYHPHLHVILSTECPIFLQKKYINNYSYDNNKLVRKFSSFEILIQKIWFLLINNIRVTKKNIDDLDIGYSCMVDLVKDDDFLEVFKYAIKSVGQDGNIISYQQFKNLYFALYNRRCLQGYGIFYNINDDFELLLNDDYDNYINMLQKKDNPTNVVKHLSDLVIDDDYTYISKYNFSRYADILKEP